MSSKKLTAIFITLVMVIVSTNFISAASYEYDKLGRLVKVTYTDDTSDSKSASYSYDKGGNITSVSGFKGNGGTVTPDPEQPTETTTEAAIETNAKVWNYTTGENTDNFFSVTASDWGSAVPITYGDITLTKAIKMESKTAITFDAPKAGKLTLVTYATAANPAININGTSYPVSSNGVTVFELPDAGSYTITKETTNTYLYYMSFAYDVDVHKPDTSKTYVWNHTDGTNTDDFYTVTANEWNGATPVTYGDLELTKAVKMESSTNITFTAPKQGTLTLVTYSTAAVPAVKLNDTSYPVSSDGASTEIEIMSAGTYTINKDTTNTYLYYISFSCEIETPTPDTSLTYVWNHTDDTNTDNFYTVTASEWNGATPVTYGDLTLTRAVKMESSTSITFAAPKSGTLTMVTYSTATSPAVKVNDQSYTVPTSGSTEIYLASGGEYTITKDTTNTYLYYMSYTVN